ncbi:MAG: glycosyltransferase [Candidatus Micrarchaeia archaeon]
MIDYANYTIVLPTLNEEATIGKLIRYLLSHYQGISVLVMDDGSKDNTRKIVERIARKNKKVRFVDRKGMGLERGLTHSIVHGLLEAKTPYAIVMDADLQHPPEVVAKIAKCLLNHDLVIAVRANVTKWSKWRKLISKSLMLLGLVVLKLGRKQTSKDIFSGFFGVKAELFKSIYSKNKQRFVGEGYKVLFDLLKCVKSGELNICEIPYTFHVRAAGSSKAGIKQAIALLKSFAS